MLSPDLLKILVCPVCKGELHLVENGQKLSCPPCAFVFPVRNGIPVLLVDEAEKLTEHRAKGHVR